MLKKGKIDKQIDMGTWQTGIPGSSKFKTGMSLGTHQVRTKEVRD